MANGISPTTRQLVDLLDSRWEIPGLRVKIGLDGIIGMVPGVGDFVGSLLGMVVIVEAIRNRVPATVLGRMLFNLWLDGVVGSIPVVGDVFDIFFKAHRRNLRLLEQNV